MRSEDQPRDEAVQAKFRHRIAHLQVWATVSASRARDLAYEWPAVAFGIAALYLLLVPEIVQAPGFLDMAVLVGVLGTGLSLYRFERLASYELNRLAEQIRKYDSESQ